MFGPVESRIERIVLYDAAALPIIKEMSDATIRLGFLLLSDILGMSLTPSLDGNFHYDALVQVKSLEPVPLGRRHAHAHLLRAACALDQYIIDSNPYSGACHHLLQDIQRDLKAAGRDMGQVLVDVSTCCGAVAHLVHSTTTKGSFSHVRL